jgi:hypothetical protein
MKSLCCTSGIYCRDRLGPAWLAVCTSQAFVFYAAKQTTCVLGTEVVTVHPTNHQSISYIPYSCRLPAVAPSLPHYTSYKGYPTVTILIQNLHQVRGAGPTSQLLRTPIRTDIFSRKDRAYGNPLNPFLSYARRAELPSP